MKKILPIILILFLICAPAMAYEKYMRFPSKTPGRMLFPSTPCANGEILSFSSGVMVCASSAGGGDLKADGTVPLTANWDVGAFTIRGTQFISDIAIGTSPFVVTSTTVVANLNSDLLDGNEASAFQTILNNSAGLLAALNDETGSGLAVFNDAPTFATSITGTFLTASEILGTDASKNIVSLAVATYPSLAELAYVKGLSSAIQTQIDLKAPLASPALTGDPTAPTPSADDDDTSIATTAWSETTQDYLKTTEWVAASKTVAGKVELATTAEIDTGTDSTRAVPVDQFVASKRNIRWLAFNLVEAATDTATATNITGDFVSPIAGTVLQSDTTPFYLYATNSTAGTTGTMVVDISFGGTSIMTTNKLDFDTTEKTTTTAATPPDLTDTTLAVGDIITIDIDAIHTTPAKGLTVYMAVRE